MADQQRKVSLIFEANANQAKNEINSLVQSLQKIQSMPRSLIDPTGIKEASKAAMELQSHIQRAINVDTGKLDLSRFATSLNQSGQKLEYFRNTLTRIGSEGNIAFQGMLRNINNAQVSTVRLTKGMQSFLTTLKNTVKWQISSSLMHSLLGTIQSATGYAKALDASLTSIRMITGQSADQMARFAQEANRAAQQLSTTTTKYTDAALIFYQQGLGDKAVKERTEAVIKMANVTGEAAADVSSYMTAIWNNFANGSKELEYYEDVITKLGATTAASSKEIAGGLEKFAAIGNTIGLSYEYATSMIATIVDKTRQSEDVVGTALKTILARVQGLNLGETLEDGTSMNKYSQALANVGVNIKDASGQLKDMDTILDELGSKWSTLSKDTQVALAQVVGGVRQYNQIISLMDNWGSFKKNVGVAESSSGTLNEQADIYAESWEAARNRVKAAAEGIYDSLLDEKVFIQLDALFTGLLNGINGVVKGMGGMVPILFTIGGFMTQRWAKEMPLMFSNMAQNLAILSGKGNNQALLLQQEATRKAEQMRDASIGNPKVEAEYESLRRVSLMREQLIKNQHQMSSAEKEQYEAMIRNEEALGRIMANRQEALGIAERETAELQKQAALRAADSQLKKSQAPFTGNSKDYENTKTWEQMEKKNRNALEKQLITDQKTKQNLMEVQKKGQLDTNQQRLLQDINYRASLYGSQNYRSQAYYDAIKNTTAQQYQGVMQKQSERIVEQASRAQQISMATNEFKSALGGEQFTSGAQAAEVLQQKLEALKSTLGQIGGTSEADIGKISGAIAELGTKADLTEDDIKKVNMVLDELNAKQNRKTTALQNQFVGLGGSKEDARNLAIQGAQRGANQASGSENDTPPPTPRVKDFSSAVSKAATAAGSLMMAYSAVNAVMSAYNTLADENATAMQKIGAIVGALVSSTMAFNSVVQLTNTLKLKETLATYAGMGAKAAEMTLIGALKAAYIQLAGAMAISTGGLTAIIAVAAIAAAALGVAIYKIVTAESEAEKKARLLKERTEGLQKAQEKLATQIQETKEGLDAYDQAAEALAACTRGTDEWYQALTDVNSAVDAILAKSPQLAKYARWDSAGNFYWAEGYTDEVKKMEAQERAVSAASAVYKARQKEELFQNETAYGALDYDRLMELREKAGQHFKDGITNATAEQFDALMKDIWSDESWADVTAADVLQAFGASQKDVQYYTGTGYLSLNHNQAFEDYVNKQGNILSYKNFSNIQSNPEVLAAQTNARNEIIEMTREATNFNVEDADLYSKIYYDMLEERVNALQDSESADFIKSQSPELNKRYKEITGTGLTYDSEKKKYVDDLGNELEEQEVYMRIATDSLDASGATIVSQAQQYLKESTEFGKQLLRGQGDFKRVGLNTEVSTETPTLDESKYLVGESLNNQIRVIEEAAGKAILPFVTERNALANALTIDKFNTLFDKDALSYETVEYDNSELQAIIAQATEKRDSLNSDEAVAADAVALQDWEALQTTNTNLEGKKRELQKKIEEIGSDQTALIEAKELEIAEIDAQLAEHAVYTGMQKLGVPASDIEENVINPLARYADGPFNLKDYYDTSSLTPDEINAITDLALRGDLAEVVEARGNEDSEIRALITQKEQAEKELQELQKQQKHYEEKKDSITSLQSQILDIDEQIATNTAEMNSLVLNSAATVNDEIKAQQAIIDDANQKMEEGKTKATSDTQLNQYKAWVNKAAEIFAENGLDIVDALGEGYEVTLENFPELREKLQSYINDLEANNATRMAELDAEIKEQDELLSTAISNVLSNYLEQWGLSLEEFMSSNDIKTYADLATRLSNGEFTSQIKAADYRQKYGLGSIEEIDDETALSLGQQYDSRAHLYSMLYNGLEIDNTLLKDDNFLQATAQKYGLVGETEEEILDYIKAQMTAERAFAAQSWNDRIGKDYNKIIINDQGLLEQGQEAGKKTSTALNAALNANFDSSQLDQLTSVMDEVQGVSSDEDFAEFDATIGKMIDSTENYALVFDVVRQAREKMIALGRELTQEEVEEILKANNTSAGQLGITIEDLHRSLDGTVSAAAMAASAFNNLTSALSNIKGNLLDLQKGTVLDKEAWGEVEDFIPKEYKDLFLSTAEGGAVFTGTDEQGKILGQQALAEAGERYYQSTVDTENMRQDIMGSNNSLHYLSTETAEDGSTYKQVNEVAANDLTLANVQDWMVDTDRSDELGAALTALGLSNEYEKVTGTDGAGLTDSEGNWTKEGNAIAQAILTALSGNATKPEEASEVLATSGADRKTVEEWNDKGLFTDEAHYQYAGSEAIKNEYSEFGISSEDIQEQIELIEKYGDGIERSQMELTEMAAEQLRFNKGLEKGRSSIKDWISDLSKGEEKCENWDKTLDELNETYSDLLDLDTDSLPQSFLESEENAKLLEKALNGDKEAFNQLQAAAAKADFLEESNLTEIPERAEEAIEKVASLGEDIPIGITITGDLAAQLDAEYLKAYNAARAGGADVAAAMEAANAAMEAAGFNVPQMEVVESDITGEIPDGWEPQENGSVIQTMPDGSTQEVVGVRAVKTEGGTYHYKQTTLRPVGEGGWKKKSENIGGGRGSGGGGGGGGGGGRRAARADKKKDSEKERYHTITNVLEDLEAAYNKISTAKDRAFGKARIKQMEEEEAALQSLISAQQDYLDEALAYLDSDMEALSSLSEMSGVALQFDENGTLLNFEELQNAMYDLYNSHINENGEADMNEEDWEKFEEQWEEQMALLEQYEETQDLVNELRQQLQDYINQIYDLRLEKVTYMVEVDIEASDDALKILDYMLSKIEDDAWSAAEAIAYMGDQAASMLDQTNTYTSGIRDILMNHTQDITDANGRVVHAADLSVEDVNAFMAGDQAAIDKIMGMNGSFTADEVEALRNYHMQLIEMNQSLIELRENMHQTVLDAFENFNEELDKSISKIDHLTTITQNYRNIVDIVGKKNLGISNDMLRAAGQVTVNQGIDRVSATRTKKETIEAEIAKAEQALENARAAGLDADAKHWEETLDQMREKLDEAEEDFLQSWEDALTSINEQFELSITQAIETFSDKMAGPLMGSLEQLQDAFERQATISELYLPNYEKIYELNKLNRDILNSIDDTDNIKGKQELAALQAEINALEAEGVEVSRYQTEDLRRRYELKLAEIALSDAQNAKSQVQMARGADGNWSYVYTANEDDVAAAEQNYEDKLFAIQQANAEYINEMQDSLIQTQVDMQARIEEIMLDETLSMEEKMARVSELTEYYSELFNYYSGQLTLGLENNSQDFHDTALATLTGFETIQDYQQNLNDAIGDPEEGGMLYELAEAYRIWQESVEAAMAAAGTDVENYSDVMAEAVNAAAEASAEATEQIAEDGDRIVETFTGIVDAVENWENMYSETIDNILAKNEALAQSFNQILQSWSDYTEATTDDAEEEPTASAPGDSGGDEGGTEEPADDKDPVAKANKYKKGIAFAVWHYPGGAGWGRGSERFRNFRKAGMDDKIVQAQINAYSGWRSGRMAADSGLSGSKESLKPYTKKHFAFDTGGYTGSWGEDGRWALLHQKEIVLNKEDTANLLSAVDMIRQIAKVIDLNAYSSAGFGSSIITAGTGSAGQFEQNVHITAEFPNATNREEIYAAFNDIVNLASQYANR